MLCPTYFQKQKHFKFLLFGLYYKSLLIPMTEKPKENKHMESRLLGENAVEV